MAEGGFLVKVNGKELCRCHTIAFDYDEWKYTVNNKEEKELPADVRSITIEVENE